MKKYFSIKFIFPLVVMLFFSTHTYAVNSLAIYNDPDMSENIAGFTEKKDNISHSGFCSHKKNAKKHQTATWLKVFIASLSILMASLIVTIFEFSFLSAAAVLAVIGWVIFGVGIVLAILSLVLGIISCKIVRYLKF